MRERRDRAGFALEARERLGVIGKLLGKHLDRNLAAEAQVFRPVHLAHAAGAERRENLVSIEESSRDQGHARHVYHRLADTRRPDCRAISAGFPSDRRPVG